LVSLVPIVNLEILSTYIHYRKLWPHNSGDDIAGIIHAVGEGVYEFKPGDRVAALHEFGTENGSYAEYAVAPAYTTFHIPHNVSFEEAATIPTAAITAATALYADLELPMPFDGNVASNGNNKLLLINGVTSAVGAFSAKLARLSGIRPIIGVAGRGGDYAKTLVDHVIDYRNGEEAVVKSVEAILATEGLGEKVPYVIDAISEGGTLETTLRFLDPNGGKVATVLPPRLFAKDGENFRYPTGVKAFNSAAPFVHSTRQDFGYVWSRYISRLLENGRLKGHPYEVIPGGLNGVLTGLRNLKQGKASAIKYVFRVEETQDDTDGYPGVYTRACNAFPQREYSENRHPLRNFPLPA
jgi:NADPH2:quinone reductase